MTIMWTYPNWKHVECSLNMAPMNGPAHRRVESIREDGENCGSPSYSHHPQLSEKTHLAKSFNRDVKRDLYKFQQRVTYIF